MHEVTHAEFWEHVDAMPKNDIRCILGINSPDYHTMDIVDKRHNLLGTLEQPINDVSAPNRYWLADGGGA